MKRIKLLIISLSLVLFFSCDKDEVREELPGIPTSISGSIKDYHRNLDVNNFEIKLIKYWLRSGGGIGPNYCKKKLQQLIQILMETTN